MNYLLRILSSEGGYKERTHALYGHIEDVYWYVMRKCAVGEVIHIYEEGNFIESVIRQDDKVATLARKMML